jgi:hypothetical protein
MRIRINGLIELWSINGQYCVVAPGHYNKFSNFHMALERFNSFAGHVLTQFHARSENQCPNGILATKVRTNLRLVA